MTDRETAEKIWNLIKTHPEFPHLDWEYKQIIESALQEKERTVRADERERCAKVAENTCTDNIHKIPLACALRTASAIRAKQKEE